MSVRDGDKLIFIKRHEADVLVFSNGVNVRTFAVIHSNERLSTFVNKSSRFESVLICEKGGCESKRGNLRHPCQKSFWSLRFSKVEGLLLYSCFDFRRHS